MKIRTALLDRMVLLMLGSMAVSACSSGSDGGVADSATSATQAGQERTNAPLKAELVNIDVKVSRGPGYDAAADQLRVTVAVRTMDR